jgi:Fic family protein
LDRAFTGAEGIVGNVMRKARCWERLSREKLNERQAKVLNQLLDGFEGKLTSSKWAALTKSSQDTAGRDIDDLVRRGFLMKNPAGGRSTSYSLMEPDAPGTVS